MLLWAAASPGAVAAEVQEVDGDPERCLHLSSVMYQGPGQVIGQFSSPLWPVGGAGNGIPLLPPCPFFFTPGSSATELEPQSCRAKSILSIRSGSSAPRLDLTQQFHSFNTHSPGSCTLGTLEWPRHGPRPSTAHTLVAETEGDHSE